MTEELKQQIIDSETERWGIFRNLYEH